MRHGFGARLTALLGTVVLLSGCQLIGWGNFPSPSPGPGVAPLSEVEAKYALLAELGDLWYCDPDSYPVAVEDEQTSAVQNWPQVTADQRLLAAILEHLGWDKDRELSNADKLAIYRQWKVLQAITLEHAADGWRFDLLTLDDAAAQTGHHTIGTISERGAIAVELREASSGPNCPICLSRGTLIDAPGGAVPVERLRVRDLVWTLDADGRRVARPLVAVASTRVSTSHRVVHLVLADGREAWVSPGHATVDWRRVGGLGVGDQLDSSRVVSVDLLPYTRGATFDLLPAGETGAYWANGIPLGSTLTR
jgi:hypothetical protein